MRASVFIAMTLDGFIARPDGKFDFLDAFGNEDHGYAEFSKSVDTLIIGRGTYDVVLAFPEWVYSGKRVVVLTSRPPAGKRANEEFFQGDVRELHARLRADGCQRAYVDGGKVIQQFLDADLIDDLTISVVPLRLGAGLPLFGTGVERQFTLTGSQAYADGLVQLRYAAKRSA
jgi:dihydrofolate reductase